MYTNKKKQKNMPRKSKFNNLIIFFFKCQWLERQSYPWKQSKINPFVQIELHGIKLNTFFSSHLCFSTWSDGNKILYCPQKSSISKLWYKITYIRNEDDLGHFIHLNLFTWIPWSKMCWCDLWGIPYQQNK